MKDVVLMVIPFLQEFSELCMTENILPTFYEPHNNAADHQHRAFRDLQGDEREVRCLAPPGLKAPALQTRGGKASSSLLAALHSRSRQVLALLGAEFELQPGHVLIHEDQATARYFFFIMEGEVELSRSGIILASQQGGTFLVSAGSCRGLRT